MAVEIVGDTNFDDEYALLQHEATGIGIVTQVKLQHVNYVGTVVQLTGIAESARRMTVLLDDPIPAVGVRARNTASCSKSAPKPRPRQSLWTAKRPRIATGTQSSRGAYYDDQSTSFPDAVTATMAETMA